MSEQQTPPPGWYPDQQGTMRWWDGQAWTAHTAQPQAPATYAPAPGAIVEQTGGVRVGRLIGGVALFLLCLVSFVNAGQQTFENGAERAGYLLVPVIMLAVGTWLFVTAFTQGRKTP